MHQFLEHAVGLLDERRFDDWLGLFADDGYYAVLQRANYERNDNMVVLGEDLKRLRARIATGMKLDLRRCVHFVSCVQSQASNGATFASANFALWRDGVPSYAGRYLLDLRGEGESLKVARWSVVLDNRVLTETVYLPI